MNKRLKFLVTLVIIGGIVAVLRPVYVVHEGEQVVVVRFGKIIRTVRDAGLQFRVPLFDNVVRYSRKILSWDGEPQRLPTSENQFVWVDTTARWSIADPTTFYESVSTLSQAYARLDDVIDSSVRTVVAKNSITEAVRSTNDILSKSTVPENFPEGQAATLGVAFLEGSRSVLQEIQHGRERLSVLMMEAAEKITPQYGIALIDIVIRQIRYSDDLTESVYSRMIKERNQIAQAYRSYGEGKKAEWFGRLEREKRTVLSVAFATSEKIKGDADAKASAIYANIYNQDPEFYRFWQSMESFTETIPKMKKTLTTDMEYFEYLYNAFGSP